MRFAAVYAAVLSLPLAAFAAVTPHKRFVCAPTTLLAHANGPLAQRFATGTPNSATEATATSPLRAVCVPMHLRSAIPHAEFPA